MSVGCKALDDDHKILIQALNVFIAALETDEVVFVTDGIFTVLADYTNYHFAREEKLLAACDYPDVAEPKKTHEALKAQLFARHRLFRLNPKAETGRTIYETSSTWTPEHPPAAETV